MKNSHSHPSNNVISVMQETEEWNTHFDGDITKLRINGEEVLRDFNLAQHIDKIGRQVRILATAGVSLAIAVLVIVSLILHKKIDEVDTHSLLAVREVLQITANHCSKNHINSRLYELTGNIWVGNKWIVDPSWHPSWQQIANSTPSPRR